MLNFSLTGVFFLYSVLNLENKLSNAFCTVLSYDWENCPTFSHRLKFWFAFNCWFNTTSLYFLKFDSIFLFYYTPLFMLEDCKMFLIILVFDLLDLHDIDICNWLDSFKLWCLNFEMESTYSLLPDLRTLWELYWSCEWFNGSFP